MKKWLSKLRDYLGFGQEPPGWNMIGLTYLFAAGLAGSVAVVQSNSWISLFDAALAGWCLHGALSTRMIKWYRDNFDEIHKELHATHELNKALLEDRVRMHLAKVEIVETDDGPAKTLN